MHNRSSETRRVVSATHTHTQKHGSDSMTSTADARGKNSDILHFYFRPILDLYPLDYLWPAYLPKPVGNNGCSLIGYCLGLISAH